MKNGFIVAVYHIGNVNMNLFVAGKNEAAQFCSIKIPINSPPSICSLGSTVHVSLVCKVFILFLDISNSKSVICVSVFMC